MIPGQNLGDVKPIYGGVRRPGVNGVPITTMGGGGVQTGQVENGGMSAPPQQAAGVPGQAPAAPGGSLSNILAGLGISNVSPLQPVYAPNAPMVAPATMQAASSNAPTSLSQSVLGMLSPQATIQQILQGAQPVFQQQQRSLNDQLAAMGMFGGPALNATGALSQQQLSSLGPTLASAIQNAQGNTLGANEFNLSTGLQQALQNAAFQQQAGTNNMSALNQGNLFNAQNIINQNDYNTQAANAAGNNLWNSIMQGWQIPFNAYQQINTAGLQGAQGLAGYGLSNAGNLSSIMANNFPVQQPPDFSGLGAALGAAFAPQQQPAPQPNLTGMYGYV